ncbi:Stp1/IreP family PP2C-type Ser/Thr phosphatase [Thalassobacillus sp. CUG 92003]|uniref:Stp1/IreP family PP2C-type Ser/Thr phosphatase n=1 Tax=Thalassobacillus sp. CUG 92003 TaxID=2736641 RepID=UPI0015E753E4|nr:Stp1/IreP family PP2C-type Ser/Thr phosphatase [Thalassobacillus sp. CUG 92003]
MNGYFLTDQGQVRQHNEDAGGLYHNANNQILAVVADGMGGHRAGDVASEMTASNLHTKWQQAGRMATPEQAEGWLTQAIHEVNEDILNYASHHEDCIGMGTTVVAAICTEQFVTVAHIGDSRCYLYNSYGFKQITQDHSLVNELVRSGQISKEEAEHHPRKNVLLKALGTESGITVERKSLMFEYGDMLLLCSDGLTNKVTDEELTVMASYQGKLHEFSHEMIRLANQRGGEDNITLAVVEYDSPDAKEGEA